MCLCVVGLLFKSSKVFTYAVVNIAVGEHGVEVLYTLLCFPVVSVLKALLNSAQIHRIFNNCIIILKDSKYTPKTFIQSDVVVLKNEVQGPPVV